MFINTLNEKRTALSFPHYIAVAGGQIGLLSGHPQSLGHPALRHVTPTAGWHSKSVK